ncbi:MAG: dethiobiotin synthase [Crocinitomicaceae bacterium]|jgi:dethiobiotin synthetase
MKYVVVGIGTDVGKTIVSSIFTKALNAWYWKPVQSGDLHFSDTDKVATYVGDSFKKIPERWRLKTPASPHYAAALDEVMIQEKDFEIPNESPLIIEGAGGLMVPLNEQGLLYIDLLQQWNLPVILVSRHYLGSINHTLLSIEALKNRNIQIEMIVFNGIENSDTESIIKNSHPELKYIRINQLSELTPEMIDVEAKRIKKIL